MNIVEQNLVNEVLSNPQNEREAAVVNALNQMKAFIADLSEIVSCANDSHYSDKEAGKIYQDLIEAEGDLNTIRRTIRELQPVAGPIVSNWYAEHEECPPSGSLEWFADRIEALEVPENCLADSALSMAIKAMQKLGAAMEHLECC